MSIEYVAHNFRCSTETRELGEASPVLKIADANLRQFETCLELLRKSSNKRVQQTAQTAFEMLGDLRHDSSWATTVSMAADAEAEAMVRPVKRSTNEGARFQGGKGQAGSDPE